MKLHVYPTSYKNAIDLINIGVNYLIIGQENFSNHKNYNFDDQELQEIINHKKNTKILILVNKLFFEQDINELSCYLKKISLLKIDGVVFADFAVIQICKELKLVFNFFYYCETLVTNYGQFEFYLKNKINHVFLSKELRMPEIQEIAINKKDMHISILGCGYAFIMESRWKMISNFNDENKSNIPLNKKLFLKEESRDNPTIIYEDKHGTYLYTNYCLSTLKYLKQLNDLNIDYLCIDSFLHDDEWTLNISKLYMDAINNINNFDLEKYQKFEISICKNDLISSGFLENNKDLIYFKNEK